MECLGLTQTKMFFGRLNLIGIFWWNFLCCFAKNIFRRYSMSREAKKATKKSKCCGACGGRDAECSGR